MNKCLKYLLAAAMALAVLTMPISVYTAGSTPKEETVYAMLNGDGTVRSVYVVNAFNLREAGMITDYGPYSEVRNLTTTDALQVQDGQIRVDAPAGRFYYEGHLKNGKLPWIIKIQYYMNGQPVTTDELAGADGDLNIRIDVRKNRDFGAAFSDHYMLQILLPMDTKKCSDIYADNAMIANMGSDKNIMFTLLPGNEDVFSVNATVTDFEMDAIQITGVSMKMDVDIDTTELSDGIKELTDGIQALNDGAADLKSGSREYAEGIDLLAQRSGDLAEASANVLEGLSKINEGMGKLNGRSGDLKDGLKKLKEGLAQYAQGMEQLQSISGALAAASGQFSAGLSQTAQGMSDILASADALKTMAEGLEGSADPQTAAFAQSYLALYDGLLGFSNAIHDLNAQYAEMDVGISQMYGVAEALSTGMTDVQSGLVAIEKGYAKQCKAISDIADGLDELTSQYPEFDDGTTQLHDGAKQLSDAYAAIDNGIYSLRDGLAELKENTDTMDEEFNDKIDEVVNRFSNEDFAPVSYVCGSNTNIKAVQFVIRTKEIAKEEGQNMEETQHTATLWQRFLDLFTSEQ